MIESRARERTLTSLADVAGFDVSVDSVSHRWKNIVKRNLIVMLLKFVPPKGIQKHISSKPITFE